MMRNVSVMIVVSALLLLGWSCRGKVGDVNVNVNAAANILFDAAAVARDGAIVTAKTVYVKLKDEGVDFSKGPCLSNAVIGGWVADIVHNPRTSVDDAPENQCSAFVDGTVKHFVELDLDGQLIRAE